MLLSISCSKDEDPAPLPETPIEPEVVLTDYSEAMNDYAATKFIFKFKPNNLDGFIVPDTIRMMLDGKRLHSPMVVLPPYHLTGNSQSRVRQHGRI